MHKSEDNMILQDEKIRLRPIEEKDTDNIIKWRNKDSVRLNFIYQKLFTVESHTNWLKTMVWTGKVKQFIIHDERVNMDVGSVFLRDIDYENQKAEYGIFIGEDSARGRGIGTMAAKMMVNYAFEELRLNKVFLRVFAENKGAVKSYEKAGFEREAYLREEIFLNGRFRDIILMSVLNQGGKKV